MISVYASAVAGELLWSINTPCGLYELGQHMVHVSIVLNRVDLGHPIYLPNHLLQYNINWQCKILEPTALRQRRGVDYRAKGSINSREDPSMSSIE